MKTLEVSLPALDTELDVKWFHVTESMSGQFQVDLWLRSRSVDIDFESVIGQQATFRMTWRPGHTRTWSGLCEQAHLASTETSGASQYQIVIKPRLSLLSHRRNHRVFQHVNVPDIVDELLGDWSIAPEWRIARADYKKLELRVQYGESDYDFLKRLLEEAGISFFFEDPQGDGESRLVLSDAPEHAAPRAAGPIPAVDNPNDTGMHDFVTNVALSRHLQPGKTTVRDFDFWRRPDFDLSASGKAGTDIEAALEDFRYLPGAFLADSGAAPSPAPSDSVGAAAGAAATSLGGAAAALVNKLRDGGGVVKNLLGAVTSSSINDITTRVAKVFESAPARRTPQLSADDRGALRHSEADGKVRANRMQHGRNAQRHRITFDTNAYDLAAGTVVGFSGHARTDLSTRQLLLLEVSYTGSEIERWNGSGTATFADIPYRPLLGTPKPRVVGNQSAVVVGPPGEEIHTDEFGRVRVQFHWDRKGSFDEKSCCWVRGVRPWAGPGYGFVATPRVGQEVLLGFLEGDPDLPVVIGCMFNATSPVPYRLPEHRTRTTWKSRSTPGGDGFNEITFEDAKDKEVLFMHAERDMQQVVRHDRAVVVGDSDATMVGTKHRVTVVPPNEKEVPTHWEMVNDRITFTTGEASITLDGEDIILSAKGKIRISSSGDDVIVTGGPLVKINCEE